MLTCIMYYQLFAGQQLNKLDVVWRYNFSLLSKIIILTSLKTVKPTKTNKKLKMLNKILIGRREEGFSPCTEKQTSNPCIKCPFITRDTTAASPVMNVLSLTLCAAVI